MLISAPSKYYNHFTVLCATLKVAIPVCASPACLPRIPSISSLPSSASSRPQNLHVFVLFTTVRLSISLYFSSLLPFLFCYFQLLSISLLCPSFTRCMSCVCLSPYSDGLFDFLIPPFCCCSVAHPFNFFSIALVTVVLIKCSHPFIIPVPASPLSISTPERRLLCLRKGMCLRRKR